MTRIRLAPLAPRALVVLAAFALSGCGREAVKYNEKLAKYDKDMAVAVQAFQNSVQAAPGNIANAKKAHAKLSEDVTRLVKEAKAVTVPDVPQGKEMHAAFGDYFDTMEKIVRDDYPRLFSEADDAAVARLEREVQAKAMAAVTKLREVQQSFAKANNFKLVDK